MTFDLFGDPTPAAAAPEPIVESFMMQPTGKPNEWAYRGVLLTCNMKLKGFIGHWQTLRPLGADIVKSDLRVALCKAIDAFVAAREANDVTPPRIAAMDSTMQPLEMDR